METNFSRLNVTFFFRWNNNVYYPISSYTTQANLTFPKYSLLQKEREREREDRRVSAKDKLDKIAVVVVAGVALASAKAADISVQWLAGRKTANRNSINPDWSVRTHEGTFPRPGINSAGPRSSIDHRSPPSSSTARLYRGLRARFSRNIVGRTAVRDEGGEEGYGLAEFEQNSSWKRSDVSIGRCLSKVVPFLHASVANRTFIQPTSFWSVIIFWELAFHGLFIRKIRSILVRFVLFVRVMIKTKKVLSTYFTFLLEEKIRMLFGQEKSYAKFVEKVYQ